MILLGAGCQTRIDQPCPRYGYWDGKVPLPFYAEDVKDAFWIKNGKPTRNIETHKRLNELERYCYQMR